MEKWLTFRYNMKILFISHYSFLYGSNRSLCSLVDFFQKKGECVSVILPSKGEFYKYLVNQGVKVYTFPFLYEVLYYKWNKKYLTLPLLWLYDSVMFPILVYKIAKINPDVIYSNSSADLISVWIAKLLKKEHVIHVREFMEEDFGGHCIWGRNIKRKIILKSDKIICVSKAVAHSVIGSLPKYGRVIYNGLPIPLIKYDKTNLKTSLRIGVVGNIDISKQQGLAISYMPIILSVFPNATLHIIGDKECPYKRHIIDLVNKLHLDKNVVFEGFVKNTEEIYRKFDVLMMCSRSEAFGRVTIEAMLRNKPVIGLNTGGTSELIEHGKTGFKFTSINDIMKALNLLVYESEQTERIIDNARNRAVELFSEINYTSNVYHFVCEK